MHSIAGLRPALQDPQRLCPLSARGLLQNPGYCASTRSLAFPISHASPQTRGCLKVARAAAAPTGAVAGSEDTDKKVSVERAIKLCEAAATTRTVSAPQVIKALSIIEKAKFPYEAWPEDLGGGKPDGYRWRLIFQAGAKQARDVLSNKPVTLPGIYFPIPAVQRWDEAKHVIENGIFLGPVASLSFRGDFHWDKRRQYFNFDTVRLRLGPKRFDFSLKGKNKSEDDESKSDLGAFFNFFLVNDTICAARGKGGGVAIWAKTSTTEDITIGSVL